MSVKTAIENWDAKALRQLLANDPSLANTLIRWGKNECFLTHPLHFISDMLFEGSLQRGMELPLVKALIQAKVDLKFQRDRGDGRKSDLPLIGAASPVGLKLLDAGADPNLRGLFGETALHWAALLGEDRFVGRLIGVADPNFKDEKIQLATTVIGDPCVERPARSGIMVNNEK